MKAAPGKRVRADQVLAALERQYRGASFDADGAGRGFSFFAGVKTGPTSVSSGAAAGAPPLAILDGLAISLSWAKPDFVGFEVKVDRGDFMRDQKWPLYLEVTHRFYFACPSGLIQPSEIDERCGLLWYSPDTGGLVTKKKARYRSIPLPLHLMYYLILSKLQPDRHPFFSRRRAVIEAFMADKLNRESLAAHFQSRLVREWNEADRRAERAEAQAAQFERDAREWQRAQEVFAELGISRGWYGSEWEKNLRKAFANKMPPDATFLVRQIADASKRLDALLEAQRTNEESVA